MCTRRAEHIDSELQRIEQQIALVVPGQKPTHTGMSVDAAGTVERIRLSVDPARPESVQRLVSQFTIRTLESGE